MYQGKKSIWQKHGDFIILDIITLQIAYLIAYMIRHGFYFAYFRKDYREVAIVMILVQLFLGFFMENYKDILKRGKYVEAKQVFVLISLTTMSVLAYLFMTKSSKDYSRAVLSYTWFLGILFVYAERIIWKRMMRKRLLSSDNRRAMVLVTTSEKLKTTYEELTRVMYQGFVITGICIVDEHKDIDFFPVGIARIQVDILFDYLRGNRVDGVFADFSQSSEWGEKIYKNCINMGITIHYLIMHAEQMRDDCRLEHIGGYMVNTYSLKFAEPRQLFLKRAMDIAGALVGMIFTGLIAIIFGPIIFIQSPGPIFFSQKRVGRNGRIFKIYKFRSMYMDAEERKKELMKQNKMQGFMFKMDDDPRIIPIGKFMRKTSLDEFPQFWNVLKGDMSMVGTRPPTVDEYEQYEDHHRARLATKPGLTGMWQVSGRSDIVDFEEVVKLDLEYIQEWDIGLDLRILFETVKIVITGQGSV